MRAAAAIPAIAILAGSALGLPAPGLPRPIGYALLAVCTATAALSWHAGRERVLVAAVGAACFVGGVLLAEQAWREAWRPTLREAFETLARAERRQAASEHRPLPEDDEAFAVVSGVLRGDAAATSSGVALSLDVDEISGRPAAARAGSVAASVPVSRSRRRRSRAGARASGHDAGRRS